MAEGRARSASGAVLTSARGDSAGERPYPRSISIPAAFTRAAAGASGSAMISARTSKARPVCSGAGTSMSVPHFYLLTHERLRNL